MANAVQQHALFPDHSVLPGNIFAEPGALRTISLLLHPPLLDEVGLSSALRLYLDGFAERSKIKVDLEIPDGDIRVVIEDKGKGIRPKKRSAMASAGMAGVGIRGMRERIRQFGGALEINSDGSGTIILARLPAGKTTPTGSNV